jgi:hypothetical protein
MKLRKYLALFQNYISLVPDSVLLYIITIINLLHRRQIFSCDDGVFITSAKEIESGYVPKPVQ